MKKVCMESILELLKNWFNDPSESKAIFIDTAGFGDSSGRDVQNLKNLGNYLNQNQFKVSLSHFNLNLGE